ncbi:hypothetical protein L226DRAFT_571456 [Lentinus tigrinus ALCF2SS1-7]|nr:hypothetical protein L226DRAFT_571456 [Lentinus tigrinus ALCF2SS1-7]
MSSVSTDPRLMQMLNIRMSEAVVDYFVDKLTMAVARATIAQPYKVAFELKTYSLMYFVHSMIASAELNMQVVLTAIVYLDRVRIDELWTYGDEFICERLAVGAFKTAFKWTYDERHHYTKWMAASHFTREDIDVMERHFLRLIDHRCWASPGAYLEHYVPLMQYVSRHNTYYARSKRASIFPPRKPEEPRIILPEHETEIVLEPALKDDSAVILPDLMYPDSDSPLSSPMSMSDDEFDMFSSDDEYFSSEDSPEVITPPDVARHGDAQPAAARAPAPASASASVGTDAHADSEDAAACQQTDANLGQVLQQKPSVAGAEMEARIRFYAADHGTVIYPSGTPQFVPPSPSNMPVQQSQCHYGLPSGTQPWHQMQAWRSASLSGNTTWGTFGLFIS